MNPVAQWTLALAAGELLHHQRVDELAEGNLYGNFRGLATSRSDVRALLLLFYHYYDFARCSWHRGSGLMVFAISKLWQLFSRLKLRQVE